MAGSDNNSTYRIEALKSAEGYLAWNTQMSDILEDQGYTKYLTDNPPTTDPDAITAWNQGDRKALTAIQLRVALSLITHVRSMTVAVTRRYGPFFASKVLDAQ